MFYGVLAVFGALPERKHFSGASAVASVAREETDQRVEILVVDTVFSTEQVLLQSEQRDQEG